MKVAEYKGYTIEFYEPVGTFGIADINGYHETYGAAKAKIDRLVKAEVKGKFPIEVVTSELHLGTITSYNDEEKAARVTTNGRKVKEELIDFRNRPKYYKANEANRKLVHESDDLGNQIAELNKRQRDLTTKLTEPITAENICTLTT